MTREETEKAIKILRWVFYRIMFADSDNPYCTPPTEEEVKWAGGLAISALEQEPCDDEITLKVKNGALKSRHGDMVIYNVEWLKKNWQMEMDIVCGVKPCDDVVSRQAVLEYFESKYPKNYAGEPELGGASCVFSLNCVRKALNELTSVQPKQKTGRWIDRVAEECAEYDAIRWKCSECGQLSCCKSKFCGDCGARMFKPWESEDV